MIRLDNESAEQLQSFAARNSESVNEAVQRLLRGR
jgi:predicted HicB family RNase H-like nuclease